MGSGWEAKAFVGGVGVGGLFVRDPIIPKRRPDGSGASSWDDSDLWLRCWPRPLLRGSTARSSPPAGCFAASFGSGLVEKHLCGCAMNRFQIEIGFVSQDGVGRNGKSSIDFPLACLPAVSKCERFALYSFVVTQHDLTPSSK